MNDRGGHPLSKTYRDALIPALLLDSQPPADRAGSDPDFFYARTLYSWVEAYLDDYGNAQPHPSGRWGEFATAPAFEANDLPATPGTLVWLRLAADRDVPAYEFHANERGGSGGDVTYQNVQINLYDTTLNYYYGDAVTYYSSINFNLNQYVAVVVNGPGFTLYSSPVILCDWLFWCSVDYTVSTSVLVDWALPATDPDGKAIVFRLSASADFAISGMQTPTLTAFFEEAPGAADGGVGWADPDRVFEQDQRYATTSLALGDSTDNLDCTTYGFILPADATIVGVEVTVRRGKAGAGVVGDTEVQLLVGGAPSGVAKSDATDWPADDGDLVLGSSSDLWGATLSVADVEAAGFGVRVAAAEDGTGAADLRVDVVLVKVYFTLPGAGQVIALAALDHKMTLLHEDSASTATNRFNLEGATNKEVEAGGIVLCLYDTASSRWRAFRQDAGGSSLPASGEAVLGSDYTVTSSYASTGLTITLPAAGEYLVQAEVSGAMTVTGAAGGYISVRLWNQTAGAVVADSAKILLQCQVVSQSVHGSVVCGRRVSVGGATVIRLEAEYTSTGSVSSASVVASNTVNGSTILRYVEVAP